MRRISVLLVVVALALSASAVFAVEPTGPRILRSVIAGGGERSASASYRVAGTIGQGLAGPPEAAAARFRMQGGFWSATGVAPEELTPSPEAPTPTPDSPADAAVHLPLIAR